MPMLIRILGLEVDKRWHFYLDKLFFNLSKDPVLAGGVVLPGGSLCLEFLTTGWAPMLTLEKAMIQIVVALVNVS